ncbi:MAG: hypothetical protein K1X74_10230 [Pirellulales bacterium]|nr:hypothetical protein [Pirellulales bacterium]
MPIVRAFLGCAVAAMALAAATAMAQLHEAPVADAAHEGESASTASPESTEPVPRPDAEADAELMAAGKLAFERSCVSCHDAEKSLAQSKDFEAWQATVARMAQKDGAEISPVTHEAIAAWLTSVAGPTDPAHLAGPPSGGFALPPLSATAALAATFRGGVEDVENQNHFGDVWLGIFAQNGSPVSGRVTSCVACHNQGSQFGNLELVEACLRLDLGQCAFGEAAAGLPVQANIEAGRFVVPFGRFYQQVNPGIQRSVTAPLIYNMGQMVHPNDLGDPVLPMPYSDEGAALNLAAALSDNWNATFHLYLVNGLSGGPQGIDFDYSRDYVDNNRSPAVGGRVAVGNDVISVGTSAATGRYSRNDPYSPWLNDLQYALFGGDVALHWQDWFWFQAEYAERCNDRAGYWYVGPLSATTADLLALPPVPFVFHEHVRGGYGQIETLLSRAYRISAFFRFDVQQTDSSVPPPGSRLPSGNFDVDRFTYGLNFTLPGGSLLLLNHEHWWLPHPLPGADVIGVRWAATF